MHRFIVFHQGEQKTEQLTKKEKIGMKKLEKRIQKGSKMHFKFYKPHIDPVIYTAHHFQYIPHL